MSRYFSRLVARATGAMVPASIAPGPRRDVSASTLDDPFEAMAPLELTPSASPPTPGLTAPLPSPAPSSAPEIAAPIAPPPIQSTTPMHGGEKPPEIPLQRAVEPENVATVTALASPPVMVIERTREHIEKRDDKSAMLVPPPPPVVSHLAESPARVELPPAQHAEPHAAPEPATLLPPVMVRETTHILVPPRSEPVAIPPPAPEPPRLVIGRLRVDVVPAPAPATPQVVRVIESRQSAAGRSTTPSSQLRFGLGQM